MPAAKKQPERVNFRVALDKLRRCIEDRRTLMAETTVLSGVVEERATVLYGMHHRSGVHQQEFGDQTNRVNPVAP